MFSEEAVRKVSSKPVFLNFAIFTGKQLCWSLLLIKLQLLIKACNFIKSRLQHRCFLVNIAKFLRTAFFCNTPVAVSGCQRGYLWSYLCNIYEGFSIALR